eukprot:33007_6
MMDFRQGIGNSRFWRSLRGPRESDLAEVPQDWVCDAAVGNDDGCLEDRIANPKATDNIVGDGQTNAVFS